MTLNIIDDNECENEETFSISLSSPDADSQSINVTIIDDESTYILLFISPTLTVYVQIKSEKLKTIPVLR